MRILLTAVAAVGLTSSAALANPWVEIPDAGDFPGPGGYQQTVGFGPLTTIHGATNAGMQDWVDSYCIVITDPDAFYATTAVMYDPNAMADWDTRLYLWDLDGNLIMANDDAPGDGLQSLITNPNTYPGDLYNDPHYAQAGPCYILTITGYSNDAQDINNVDLVSFASDFDALHGKNPASGAFDHWENVGATGEYVIGLGGATFCIPGPGALALLGLAGLITRRRR